MDRAELNTMAATLPTSEQVTDKTLLGVMRYLDEFGYLDEFAIPLPSADPTREAFSVPDVARAVREAQRVLGIEDDGIPGEQTLKAVQTIPRCGLRDYGFARDTLARWSREKADKLVYCITDYLPSVPKATQDQIIIEAWTAWEGVCKLVLHTTKRSENADIIISCSGSRQEEFGTAGNVLAWAELPQSGAFAGKLLCKFDTAERWGLVAGDPGILLLNVATHEFGHLLGLDHTNIRGELMFPTYSKEITAPQPRYDIPSVVERYGAVVVVPGPLPPNPPGGLANIEVTLKDKITGATRVL